MKFIILAALALVAVASALPVDEKPIETISQTSDQQPDGGYSFAFESSDGAKRQENGVVKEVRDEENNLKKVVVVRGSYSYQTPEGNEVYINYTADEEGFHPEGPSIPTAPVVRR